MRVALLDDEDDPFREALAEARTLLKPERRREPVWPALAAASLFAFSAFGFAATVILAAPVQSHAPSHDSLRGAN
jgi:hypothetical protein